MDSTEVGIELDDAVPQARSATAFELDAADAKLLTEIGFLAAYQGDVTRADAVFDALASIRPGRAYPWVGKTLARFHAGRPDEAVAFLERVQITDQEESAVLQAWRGFALQLSGHAQQARTLLEKIAQGTGPGPDLARSLLGSPEGS